LLHRYSDPLLRENCFWFRLKISHVRKSQSPNRDNWKDSQQSALENTGLQPPNDLDAAILATLPAGNYTAIVTDKNGSTGVGLIEVYATH
jgi:hypothetical protein